MNKKQKQDKKDLFKVELVSLDSEDNIKEGIWCIDYKQDEYDKILDEYYVYCSNCHTAVYTDIDPDNWHGGANYCPVCGARMKNR